jgi:hypothetical protein
MESISHRFTTPTDQLTTDLNAGRNGQEGECMANDLVEQPNLLEKSWKTRRSITHWAVRS